jgi:uncharacterized LabA/DUF88 family protein
MFYQNERIALFIDGANLYATAKSLAFDIDFRRLLREFQSRGRLLRAYYFTTISEEPENSTIRPLLDWLDYNGYAVITKPNREFIDSAGRRRIKGSLDIEVTLEAIEIAERVDHIILFSGDGDFKPLVAALQKRGCRVSVASTVSTQPVMISDDLRRQADHFIDLVDLIPQIGRDPGERAQRSFTRAAYDSNAD